MLSCGGQEGTVGQRNDELDRRKQAVRWHREGISYTEICRRLGRSRPWLAKWLRRSRADPRQGLLDRSRRPRRVRRPVSAKLVARIVALRVELEAHKTQRTRFRGVGAVDIQEILRDERRRVIPSISTIERVLRKHGYRRCPRRRVPSSMPYPWPRAKQPGDLQQTDLVGPRYLRGRRGPIRFYSIHTIALVGRGVWASQHRHKTSDAFCAHFVGAWRWLGVPRVSQLDNEMAATGGGRHRFGLSAVARLHLLVGTHLLFVPAGEPGRNPVVESFNHVWQERVLREYHPDLRRLRRASTGHWRFYHYRKAHRALTVNADGTRFAGEWLRLHRDALRWLPADFTVERYQGRRGQLPVAAGRVSWVQRVDADGTISINARPYFIGKRRTGEYVQATLFTHRQRVVVYSAYHRRIKDFPFPVQGELVRPVL